MREAGTEIAGFIPVFMEKSVSAHIAELERTLRQLNDELMHEDDLRVRNDLEGKVRAAEMALQHYQAALELEQNLARDRH